MSSDALKVVSLCAYLTGDLKRRDRDWPAFKMVQALKGNPIKGYFDLTVSGVARRFDQQNISAFLATVPEVMESAIAQRVSGPATLVPIPNSTVTDPASPDFKTLNLARGIAAHSKGRFRAVPALVFSTPQHKSSNGGPRSPEHFFDAYRIVENVDGPIILIDDVCTLGGHFVGACWKLNSPGRKVVLGCTLGWTTHEYQEVPVRPHEHEFSLVRVSFGI